MVRDETEEVWKATRVALCKEGVLIPTGVLKEARDAPRRGVTSVSPRSHAGCECSVCIREGAGSD